MQSQSNVACAGVLAPVHFSKHGFYINGIPEDANLAVKVHTVWMELCLRFRLGFKGMYRGFIKAEGVFGQGRLYASLITKDGDVKHYGLVSTKVVTTAGVNYMRDDFNNNTGLADITNFNFHDSGTGTGAEAVGDTALGTAAGPARVTGTQSAPATKQYRTVGTITYTSTLAITEHGIFSASSSGTLWDRSVFGAINVNNGDSIQFTYTLKSESMVGVVKQVELLETPESSNYSVAA